MIIENNTKLGKILINNWIASGSVGDIYYGRNEDTNQIVAVKILKEKFLSDEKTLKHFKKEAEILQILDIPQVVKVYDFDYYQKQPYFVMEYVEGHSLKEKIKTLKEKTIRFIEEVNKLKGQEKENKLKEWDHNQFLSVRKTISIICEIALIMEGYNRLNIVHCDIKPENIHIISIKNEDKVKMLDFGIAKTELEQTHIGFTVDYAAPEVTSRNRDIRTDIYSLGIIFYEMVSGEKPFKGDVHSIMGQHKTEPLPKFEFIDPTCNTEIKNKVLKIINKATQKDKNNRYSDPREMIQDIEKEFKNIFPEQIDWSKIKLPRQRMKKENKIIISAIATSVLFLLLALFIEPEPNAEIDINIKEPKDVYISLNGSDLNEISIVKDHYIKSIKPGKYTINIRKDDYKDKTLSLDLESKEVFSESIELEMTEDKILALARKYLADNKFKEAIELLDKSLKKQPQNLNYKTELSAVYLLKAVKLAPSGVNKNNFTNVYNELNKNFDFFLKIKNDMKLENKDLLFNFYSKLGQVFHENKNNENALICYQRALKISSSNVEDNKICKNAINNIKQGI